MWLPGTFFIVLFVAWSETAYKVSAYDSISYIAAVAEYFPIKSGDEGPALAITNANNFVTIIQKAANYSTDIIVFPESALTTGLTVSSLSNRTNFITHSSFVPEPGTAVLCENSTTDAIEALKIISCAARNYSMYVAVNLHEKENCTGTGTTERPCPSDGYFFYNTNVVFNRTGGIVARYRKFNLFGEPGFNTTATAENSTFTTDFNVTFGQFICFDLLFKTPTLTLVNDLNVTDIIFSAHWFSELPYLTSVQVQSAWSYANNVNLLASGYNTPASGSGGSGIYAGIDGNLTTLWSETATNTLLVARVPFVNATGARNYTGFNSSYPITYQFNNTEITTLLNIVAVDQQSLIQDTVAPYNTTTLTLANGTFERTHELCHNDLCCNFNVSATYNASAVTTNSNYYKYRLSVFNGVRSFSGVATGGTQHCSLISCTNDTLDSCGLRFDANDTVVYPTTIHSIVINGNFSTNDSILMMPDSLTTSILPLHVNETTWLRPTIQNTSLANVTFSLTTNQTKLLTFAIFARNFTGDGLEVTTVQVTATNSTNSTGTTSFAVPNCSPITSTFLCISLLLVLNNFAGNSS